MSSFVTCLVSIPHTSQVHIGIFLLYDDYTLFLRLLYNNYSIVTETKLFHVDYTILPLLSEFIE